MYVYVYVYMPQKTLYVRDADLPIWEAAQKHLGEKSMSTQVIEVLREKLSSGGKYDYVIKMLNGGEVGIEAQTDRAQERSRLKAGLMIAFKSRVEAAEYVEAAETEGLTFSGKEALKSGLPIGVGDASAQARFIANNRDFLLEHPNLHELCEKVVLRRLKPPPQEEVDRLLALPDNDPAVIAFENQVMADRIVFGLGRVIVDDFGEVITLSGNARGIGALKILRGMYERLVTIVYIAKNPAEARAFTEDDIIKKWKLWKSSLEVWPDLKGSAPKGKVEELEAEYERVKAKRAGSICKKCGQPITQGAWTRVDVASMAKQSDARLAKFYRSCYLEPTFHLHATGFGLNYRFRRTEQGGKSYVETSEPEARMALQLAHNLILYFLDFQNEYFDLGLADEIKPRLAAFLRIWGRADQPASAA
jgi:hypothetical protein